MTSLVPACMVCTGRVVYIVTLRQLLQKATGQSSGLRISMNLTRAAVALLAHLKVVRAELSGSTQVLEILDYSGNR